MHRIDDPTAVPTLPAPRGQGTPGYFTGGSPGSSGFAATVVRYEFMNALQEEFAAVIESAGMALDKTNNAQLLAALRSLFRPKLFQDETLYISPAGDDANDGLTPATPLRTGQAAWSKAIQIDLNNHSLVLQFADGTYPDPLTCLGLPLGVGFGRVIIRGNLAAPSNVIFSATNATCITAANGASVFVDSVRLTATGSPVTYENTGMGLVAIGTGQIQFSNVDFGPCSFSHMQGVGGGFVNSNGSPYKISGGGKFHVNVGVGGFVGLANSAVTLTGTPAFATEFIYCGTSSVVSAYGMAFSGAATGARWRVDTNATIITEGGGPNYLPGNAAGITDATTYGVYT